MSTTARNLFAVLVLLCMFACSLIVRADVFRYAPLGVPLYDSTFQRQENTEVFDQDAYVLSVYKNVPLSQHLFAPYIGSSPNFLQNRFNHQLTVYPSFSPIMFIVPYVVLSVTHIGLSYTGLQFFSLFIHLVCIFLVYFLVRAFLPKDKYTTFIAILCASVYTFATNTLQSHMNVYWAHQLLQPFYFGFLLFLVKRRGIMKWWEAAIIGFILSIITWTGAVIAFCFAAYYLLQYKKLHDKKDLHAAFGLLGGVAFAVILIAGQIFWVTGASVGKYITKVFARVQARSFEPNYAKSIFQTPIRFLIGLATDACVYIALALGFLLAYGKRWWHSFRWTLIAITLFPLLESVLLLEHDTVYTFGRLKYFIPLILILALGSYEFLKDAKNKRRNIALLTGAFTVAAIIHIFLFLAIYTPHY